MSEPKPESAPDTLPKPVEPDQPKKEQEPPSRSSGSVPLVLALLALGLTIGLVATAYFTWSQVQQLVSTQAGVDARVENHLQPLRQSLDGVSHEVQGVSQSVQAQRQQINSQLQRLEEDQQSVGNRLNVLATLMGRSEQGWNLAEVEYLLRIANQRLQLQRDVTTAEEALKAADDRLRELADPHYLGVREQIARDIEAVQAVPGIDIDGISVALSASLEVVDELPVAGTRYQPAMNTEAPSGETKTTARNWRELPDVLWASLSGLFQIREHDKPITPMLPPEREYFLRENLRLQLGAARLALLRDDNAQYQATLNTARSWLGAYFDTDDEQVQELAARLESMAVIDVAPKLPDVSGSLRVLRQQIKLSEQQAVLPVVPVVPSKPLPQEAAPESDDSGTETKEEAVP